MDFRIRPGTARFRRIDAALQVQPCRHVRGEVVGRLFVGAEHLAEEASEAGEEGTGAGIDGGESDGIVSHGSIHFITSLAAARRRFVFVA